MKNEEFATRKVGGVPTEEMKSQRNRMRWLLYGAAFFILHFSFFISSCARMGQPDGGWYDDDPPRIISTSPQEKSVNIANKKITINFNEYIKLENPTEKVIISPPQIEQAEIKGQGKKIVVQLVDSLKDNTTYTIDFSDAISDNTEGNPFGNYTYTFSTGDHIDTMEVAGYVLEAENLEPIKGIMVGLYDNLSDTVFKKEQLMRVSRTDSRGHFVIKGVSNGSYRVYALQDADANFMFSQKSEKLAFNKEIYTTSSRPDTRQDTIWRDSLHISDIRRVPYTHFLPDDVMLRAFTEPQTDRFLIKSERKEANRFVLFFSYGHPELPQIKGLNFDEKDAFVIEPSIHQDTITYWLKDTLLVNQDTLMMELKYEYTDSLGKLQPKTDTLEVLSKQPYEKRLKAKTEEYEKWKKQQEKNKKKGNPYETEMPKEYLKPNYNISSTVDPDNNPSITMPVPLEVMDTSKIHLYSKVDTAWYNTKFLFGKHPAKPRTYQLVSEWKPDTEYSLEIDSAAFIDIYGNVSQKEKKGFMVPSEDKYCTIILNISEMSGKNMILWLMDPSERVLKEVVAEGDVATFYYVNPGEYYVKMFVDDNQNGKWDTGDYEKGIQPEEVYYYPQKIECRAKWDYKQTWNPKAKKLNVQKPAEIVKQKGDTQKKVMDRNNTRARELGIEYVKKIK